jgi:hypothetical protein
MPFKTAAPLPADLKVTLARVASRPDPWSTMRMDESRPHYSIRLERNGRKAGPFFWTGPVDLAHEQQAKRYRFRETWKSPGQPKGTLTPEEAMASLALDASCYSNGPDLDTFASELGYDGSKPSEIVRAFEACRRVWETFALLGLDPNAPCFQEA